MAKFPSVLDLSDLNVTESFALNGGAAGSVSAAVAAGDAVTTGETVPLTVDLFADNGAGPDPAEFVRVAAINGAAVAIGDTVALPSGALVTIGVGGNVTYDPNGAFNLSGGASAGDSFTYTAGSVPPAIDLSALDASNGFVLNGVDAGDLSGISVSGAGDLNGDGIDDLVIGAIFAAPNGNTSAGESYVVFGSSAGFGASFDLSGLDGSNGFVLNGIDTGDRSGWSVSAAGDVNGDGIGDLLIGTSGTDPNGNNEAGETYVVFGSSSGHSASLDLSALDGSNGFVLNGIDARDYSGWSVSGAGDINGDGIDDLLLGAPLANSNGNTFAGESYVVFGSSAGFGASFELSSLDGSNGFILNGADALDRSGWSVSGAGDVNGDGIGDVVIGAYRASPNGNNNAGASYVVFGSSAGFGATFELSSLDGSNGFVLNGTNNYDNSGDAVSSAGDVNGDGIDDLLIGAYGAGLTVDNSGKTYVVFGSTSAFGASLELSALDGSNGFVINGTGEGDQSGSSVASAGDLNGDGIDDLLIGAVAADPDGDVDSNSGSIGDPVTGTAAGDPIGSEDAGKTYVVFGSSAGFAANLELSDLDGSNGFVLNGIDGADYSGFSVAAAGDVNGDGISDLLTGAPFGDPNGNIDAGETYVVYGGPTLADRLSQPATVSVTVTDVPNAVDDLASTDEFTPVAINLFADNGFGPDPAEAVNVAEINGVAVATGEVVTLPSGALVTIGVGGNITYDPNGAFDLSGGVRTGDSFTYTAGLLPAALELSDIDGSNGFVLNGVGPGDVSGRSVSAAGDVNGDGIDDLVIGATGGDPNGGNSGESYVVFGSTAGFGASLELSSLDGTNGFVLNGINGSDESGYSVSEAGDINGDGIDDVLIAAPYADGNGNTNGESYVVFGSTAGFGAGLELSSLDGSNGFVMNGVDLFGNSGRSVSAAGDVNGDGIDDLLIGAPDESPPGASKAGKTYVVFGSDTGFAASLDLSALDGGNGFVLNGVDAFDNSGRAVSAAGDVNGDGIEDLLIGAYKADPNGDRSGEGYVVFGSLAGFGASFDLSALDGSNGFVLNGVARTDLSGFAVSTAGDVNDDGIDDIMISATGARANGHASGETYVVFGSTAGFAASLELSALDGSNGFVLNGAKAGDESGVSIAAVGDVNGDGIGDLLIGARFADPNGNISGESYVVFGSSAGFAASLELSSLDGTNGFVLYGVNSTDQSGTSVSGAGDVNGDGISDLLIGAIGGDPDRRWDAGETYVVYGGPTLADRLSQPATVSVTIHDVDLAPVVAAGQTIAYAENQLPGVSLGQVSASDDVGVTGFQIAGGDPGGYFDINSAGHITLTAAGAVAVANDFETLPNSFGLAVTAGDAAGNISAAELVTLNVLDAIDANQDPVAADDIFATDEDTPIAGHVFADNGNGADSDPDGHRLTVSAVNGNAANVGNQITLPSGALLALNSDGSFIYDPNGQFVHVSPGDPPASDGFTYDLSDGNGGSSSASVVKTINGLWHDVIGTPNSDTLHGGALNDRIQGLESDDTLFAYRGNDLLLGGPGDDNLYAGPGSDYLDGGIGNDRVIGHRDADTLIGGADSDTLLLRWDDDAGTGGAGTDHFILDGRYVSDGDAHVITDLDIGNGESLTFRFFEAGTFSDLLDPSNALSTANAGGTAVFDSTADIVEAHLSGRLQATDDGNGDTLLSVSVGGNALSVQLQGVTFASLGIPGGMPDLSPGDDVLVGSGRNDDMRGYGGDDLFLLRYGSDTATGGTGADAFIVDGRYINDGDSHTITDLNFAEGDFIRFRFVDPGTFDNSLDPVNWLSVKQSGLGETAVIDSVADLHEAALNGVLQAASTVGGTSLTLPAGGETVSLFLEGIFMA